MKDSERAKDFLYDLYVRQPIVHPYEPANYERASNDMVSVVDLIDLLEEVRQDERKNLLL